MRDRAIHREHPRHVVAFLAPRHRKKGSCETMILNSYLEVLANRWTAYQGESVHSICRQRDSAARAKRCLPGFRELKRVVAHRDVLANRGASLRICKTLGR